MHYISLTLKVALQVLGRKFYKNTKKSSLYSQSLLVFIKKNHNSQKPSNNKRNYRFTMAQGNTNGKHGLSLHEQLTHLHTEDTQTKLQTLRPMKTLWKIITCLLCYGASLATGNSHYTIFLNAHLSTECSVSYCDHSPSVVVRPSTIFLLTL